MSTCKPKPAGNKCTPEVNARKQAVKDEKHGGETWIGYLLHVLVWLPLAAIKTIIFGQSPDGAPTVGIGPAALVQTGLDFKNTDFNKFMKEHWELLAKAKQDGNHGPAVCHYYEIMGDLLTRVIGPYWHFVPWLPGRSREESHELFHQTMVRHLKATPEMKILEVGAGFGECGRRVAHYSGCKMTALTMSDVEVTEGNKRILKAGLEKQCDMVQGDYHDLRRFPDNTFDAVFGIYCLKYSPRLSEVISEAYRVLKPGGRFVSYEILVSDDFDPSDKAESEWVRQISDSTGMPPLWHANDFRKAANDCGFVNAEETDIAEEPVPEKFLNGGKKSQKFLQWYRWFDAMMWLMDTPITKQLCKLGETLKILGPGFSEFYDGCLVHPLTDFYKAGKAGVIECTLMMSWEKPGAPKKKGGA